MSKTKFFWHNDPEHPESFDPDEAEPEYVPLQGYATKADLVFALRARARARGGPDYRPDQREPAGVALDGAVLWFRISGYLCKVPGCGNVLTIEDRYGKCRQCSLGVRGGIQ